MSVKVGAPRTALSMLSRTCNLSGGPRLDSKIQQLGVSSSFKILHDRIVTPGDGLIIFQGTQDANTCFKLLCGWCPALRGHLGARQAARCVQARVERTHVTKLARLMLPLPSR